MSIIVFSTTTSPIVNFDVQTQTLQILYNSCLLYIIVFADTFEERASIYTFPRGGRVYL